MNKTFKFYLGVWAVCFAVFNISAFVIPDAKNITMPAFWIGYSFIVLSFIGNIAVAKIAFKAENLKKMFYNMSLIVIGYTGLFIMLAVGALAMIMPLFPLWLSVTLCVLVEGATAIAVISACFAADTVVKIDEKIEMKTFFIKSLTAKAKNLMLYADSEELKIICKRVYEKLKYSDPVSNMMLSDIEAQIQSQFSEFEVSVNEGDIEVANEICKELIGLIDSRNSKCKFFK